MPPRGWRPTEETRAKLRAAWKRRAARLPGFWDRVQKTETCWIWTRGLTGDGYGQYRASGRNHLAHRYAYEQLVGAVPDGMELDHLCRNRACVNPDHLEAVTPQLNQHRGMGFAGRNARKTACIRGHLFAEYGYVQATGKRAGRRRCRACDRARNRVWMRDYYRRRYIDSVEPQS